MTTSLRLSDYATTPLYNIKAVVQATGISPSTLRAWERRYNMCRPHRSESGYRLYAERDVTIIRWLKAQVDAGMSISQAVSWLEKLAQEAGGLEHVVLPAPAGGAPLEKRTAMPNLQRAQVRDFEILQSDLLQALLAFDEEKAEQVVAEAFAMYPVEQVGENLFMPVLVEVGERWSRGEVSVTTEHFISNYLIQRLAALLRSLPNASEGPLIWIGCAPTELHEVGALLLGIYLRRSGYRVHYLGQSLPLDNLAGEVQRHHPALLLLSASTQSAADELAKLSAQMARLNQPAPLFGYGGQIFNRLPELRAHIAGTFMGRNAQEAVQHVDAILLDRQRNGNQV
ncbi:MAG TPA: B12-binding domain-containing protein, partial [Caldilineaceae bacterium]|nr:B12-binding domain-containing protein [Caldilineaceae bacterium]